MKNHLKIGAATLTAIIILGLVLVFYKVDETENAIVTQFGKPIRVRVRPGLYVKWPDPIQTVNRFDNRLQLYKTKLIEYLTKYKKNIIVQCFVVWKIGDTLKFFEAVGNQFNAEQKLYDIVCAQLGALVGSYPMSAIISTEEGAVKLPEMETIMIKRINEKTSRDYGITIARVGINRLALPVDNARSVFKRMIAERKAIANKYRAEGEEKASEIKANADREGRFILSKAYREAEITMGEGDASATKIYADAYKTDPEFYQFLRTLESYKVILDKDTAVVLSSDSKLLELLNEKAH